MKNSSDKEVIMNSSFVEDIRALSLLNTRRRLSRRFGVVLPPDLDRVERPKSGDLYDPAYLSEEEMFTIVNQMCINIDVWPGQEEAFQAALDRLEAEIGVDLSSRGFAQAIDGLYLKYAVRDLPPKRPMSELCLFDDGQQTMWVDRESLQRYHPPIYPEDLDEDGKSRFGPGVPFEQFFANRQRQRRRSGIHQFYRRLVTLVRSLFS